MKLCVVILPVIIITGFKAPERDWPVTTITGLDER